MVADVRKTRVGGGALRGTRTMAEEMWEHIGDDDDARVGPRLERDPPPIFTTPANSYTHRQMQAGSPTFAFNDSLDEALTGRMAVETTEKGKPYGGRSCD